MPVTLGSKLPPENEARIEIIPLIDIMFFLLAAFMLVSLSMVNLKGIRVNLPTATTDTADSSRNLVRVVVDPAGLIYLDDQLVGNHELAFILGSKRQAQPELRVLVSGDRDARHGDVIRALDLVRSAGIQQVAFEIGGADVPLQP
ncbi:MAG: biopolymer transporter ExbD [Verrucomicrobia bacterium]|nr:biopolymer transporter ExbD [Verrucomicrobiota bacterium]